MRWFTEVAPELYSHRVQRGFLFLPKRIGNEVRWLEKTAWIEEYQSFKGGDHWWPVEWAGEPIPYRITPAGIRQLSGDEE